MRRDQNDPLSLLTASALIAAGPLVGVAYGQQDAPAPSESAVDAVAEAQAEDGAAGQAAGGTVDSERVIEYDLLNRAMEQAAEAVVDPIRESQLSIRFRDLLTIAKQDDVDNLELQRLLVELRDELDTFSGSLDQAPIWEAQTLIGDTVERVRLYVTQGPAGVPTAELEEQVAELDKQLARLARMIEAEPDPNRVRRLRALFGHQLRMKRLKETAMNIDTSDPSVAVWLDIAGSLERISTQLTTTAFTVEEARLSIQSVSDRLTLHIKTLEALTGRERVANAISAVGSTSGELADAMRDLIGVAKQASELDTALQALTARMVADVEAGAAEIPNQESLGLGGLTGETDIDAEIKRYLEQRPEASATDPEAAARVAAEREAQLDAEIARAIGERAGAPTPSN